jgi:hypothetical protein
MTVFSQNIKRKLSLLPFADELGTVAKACRSWAARAQGASPSRIEVSPGRGPRSAPQVPVFSARSDVRHVPFREWGL